MSASARWPMHYTFSRPAWYRRWVVWRHLPIRRIEGELYEWDACPSVRFWSRDKAWATTAAFNGAVIKQRAEGAQT